MGVQGDGMLSWLRTIGHATVNDSYPASWPQWCARYMISSLDPFGMPLLVPSSWRMAFSCPKLHSYECLLITLLFKEGVLVWITCSWKIHYKSNKNKITSVSSRKKMVVGSCLKLAVLKSCVHNKILFNLGHPPLAGYQEGHLRAHQELVWSYLLSPRVKPIC